MYNAAARQRYRLKESDIICFQRHIGSMAFTIWCRLVWN